MTGKILNNATVDRGCPSKSIVWNSKMIMIFTGNDIEDLISNLLTKGQLCPSSSGYVIMVIEVTCWISKLTVF